MNRPPLTQQPTKQLTVAQFDRWYWLKDELVLFCRGARLPTAGSKLEVADRIRNYLDGKPTAQPIRARREKP